MLEGAEEIVAYHVIYSSLLRISLFISLYTTDAKLIGL